MRWCFAFAWTAGMKSENIASEKIGILNKVLHSFVKCEYLSCGGHEHRYAPEILLRNEPVRDIALLKVLHAS